MNRIFFYLLLSLTSMRFVLAQEKFQIDTIRYQGPDDKMVNFVILGDGYTLEEQDKFSKDAETFVSFFF